MLKVLKVLATSSASGTMHHLNQNPQTKAKDPPNRFCFFREKIQIPDVCVCDRSLATREWLPVFQSRVFGGWGWLSNCSSQDQQRHRGKGLSAGGDKRETIVSVKLKRPQIKWIVYFLPEVLIRNLHGTPRHTQCWERAHRMVCRSLWVRYKNSCQEVGNSSTTHKNTGQCLEHAQVQEQGTQGEPGLCNMKYEVAIYQL